MWSLVFSIDYVPMRRSPPQDENIQLPCLAVYQWSNQRLLIRRDRAPRGRALIDINLLISCRLSPRYYSRQPVDKWINRHFPPWSDTRPPDDFTWLLFMAFARSPDTAASSEFIRRVKAGEVFGGEVAKWISFVLIAPRCKGRCLRWSMLSY